MGDVPSNRTSPVAPSILEQGTAIVREQTTNSAAVTATADRDGGAEAVASVKAGGSSWSVAAWARWAKEKWSGRSEASVGVSAEKRW